MRVACWIPKATNTQTAYIIAFPLPQRLDLETSMFRYTCISCVVLTNIDLRAVLHHEKLRVTHFSPDFMEIIK
jgi:hypothetical protein